jgi:hypothetical protein
MENHARAGLSLGREPPRATSVPRRDEGEDQRNSASVMPPTFQGASLTRNGGGRDIERAT